MIDMIAALMVNLIVLFTIPAILRVRAERFLKSPHFERWAGRFGIQLTADNTPYIREHLATGMKWRHRGGFIGMAVAAVPALISSVTQESSGLPSIAGLPFVGYLGGTAIAERVRWRQGLVGTPRASLTRRTPADYVARWGRGLLVMLVAASAVIAPMAYSDAPSGRHRLGIATSTLLVLAVVGLIEWALRAIAVRPQAMVDQDMLAADNAVRSYSSHVLVGLGIAVAAISVLPMAGDLILDWRGFTKTVLSWVFFVTPTSLIGVGYYVAMTSPWRHSSAAVVA